MSLDQNLKEQLKQYLALLENPVVFHASLDSSKHSNTLRDFLSDIASLSSKISIKEKSLPLTPSFAIDSESSESGIVFAGLPLGHEFESFVLALLQVSGRAPKISQEQRERILAIEEEKHFTSYVGLSCHNCPDVVQALNIVSVLNPLISHTMVEGSWYQELVDKQGVMAVPALFEGDEQIASGRQTLDQILDLITDVKANKKLEDLATYDVLIIGGGPAGMSAAVYAARKGIKTGLIAENFGGQVNDTLGIENFIGTSYIEGPQLMNQIKRHVEEYNVDFFETYRAKSIMRSDDGLLNLETESGTIFKSKTLILATGAKWKDIHVPGEKEFQKKGIAYCVHCDGPLFRGKKVAVVGGGNSGIEAAIDLANLAEEVKVIEFMPELNADQVLQNRVRSLANIEILTNHKTTEIHGDNKVQAISVENRDTGESLKHDVDGVFIQVGLRASTDWLGDTISRNQFGEIEINARGETSLPGVFAAGDCATTAYKQIVIAMGSGATAALSAFDYLMRNN